MKGKTQASNRSSVDKEGKKEAAINQSIRKVNCGDLLWVQLHGSSWWPAQIVDDSIINAIHKPRERRKGEVLVRLYGSYKYLFVDPISSCLEFENTLNKYGGSHSAILKESLKQDLCQLKSGASTKKEMKMRGKGGADSSQERIVKQKQKVCSSSRELDANSPAKRSKETSIGLVSTKENGSRKRKKEEAQKKSKSNSRKSATEERNNRKEKKMEPQNKTPPSRKQEQDMESKKPKADGAVSPRTSSGRSSASATAKPSVKRGNSLSDESEKGNNKKQKQSGTQKNLGPNSPNLLSRRQGSANQGHSLSKKMGSLRTNVQTQKTVQRKLGKSDAGKISQANKDAGRKKNAKPSEQEIVSSTLEETDKEPSARKLKVMRILGLIAPAGSPFIRNGSVFGAAN